MAARRDEDEERGVSVGSSHGGSTSRGLTYDKYDAWGTLDAWSTPDPWGPSPFAGSSRRRESDDAGGGGDEEFPATPDPSEVEAEEIRGGTPPVPMHEGVVGPSSLQGGGWKRLAAPRDDAVGGGGGGGGVVVFDDALDVLARLQGPVSVVCGVLLGAPWPAEDYGEVDAQGRLLGSIVSGSAAIPVDVPGPSDEELGMWVWDAPRARRAADGTPMHVAAAVCRPGSHAGLGALAVVLSSAMAVVHAGPADDQFLERMAFVKGVSQATRSWAGRRMVAPSLAVILHGLDLGTVQRKIDPDAYLAAALEARGRVRGLDDTREALKAVFPDTQCIANGVKEGEGVARWASGAAGCPKRMGHVVVPGPLLADLARVLGDMLDTSMRQGGPSAGQVRRRIASVPGDAWEVVRERCCQAARDHAASVYLQERAVGQSGEEEDAEREHQRCTFAALATFRARAVGELDVLQHHEAVLLEQVRRLQASGAHEFVPEGRDHERTRASPRAGEESDEHFVEAALAAFHRAMGRARKLSRDLESSLRVWQQRNVPDACA